jgi:hypothetical protein
MRQTICLTSFELPFSIIQTSQERQYLANQLRYSALINQFQKNKELFMMATQTIGEV